MFYDLTLHNVIRLMEVYLALLGTCLPLGLSSSSLLYPPDMVLLNLGCAEKTSAGKTEFGHYSGYPLLPFRYLVSCV